MKRVYVTAILVVLTLAALPLLAQTATGTAPTPTPPPNFKKVSTLVNLPDWLPGLGTLYVDPSTVPVGPYLGYNHNGKLVNVVYMISIKDFDQHKNLHNLGEHVAHMGLKVDHTDVDYNPGHPGVPVPHYHITQWLITPAQQAQEMK